MEALAQFTGVSRYTLDGQSRVLRQQDYWDSVNLRPGANGGSYAEQPKLAAVRDLLGQLAPGNANQAQQASSKELPYVLLRRAAPRDGLPGYEIRRYPQHVSVKTSYFQRIDAFGTLGAYCNGANEDAEELKAYVPSLMSVPRLALHAADPRRPLGFKQREPDGHAADGVPALQDARRRTLGHGQLLLDLNPSRVVAVFASRPDAEPTVRGYRLLKYLDADGLTAAEGEGNGERATVPPRAVRRAQLVRRAPLRDLGRPRRGWTPVEVTWRRPHGRREHGGPRTGFGRIPPTAAPCCVLALAQSV